MKRNLKRWWQRRCDSTFSGTRCALRRNHHGPHQTGWFQWASYNDLEWERDA